MSDVSPDSLSDKPRLFTYGSLMFPKVWKRVAGTDNYSFPARLGGFEARRLAGLTYPGLLAVKGGSAAGLLYVGVSTEALHRLDAFEGRRYERITVHVTVEGHPEPLEAFTYLLADQDRGTILPEIWDAEEFRTHHLKDFVYP